MKTRTEMYQERLQKLGYSDAISYALSIVIFNCNSHVQPDTMSNDQLLKEIALATAYLKNNLDKQFEVATKFINK